MGNMQVPCAAAAAFVIVSFRYLVVWRVVTSPLLFITAKDFLLIRIHMELTCRVSTVEAVASLLYELEVRQRRGMDL